MTTHLLKNTCRKSLLIVSIVLTGTLWLAGCAEPTPDDYQRITEAQPSSIDDFEHIPDYSWVRPSVFIEGESFAQSFAVSENADVLFAAMPTAASVSIYLRHESNWIETQRIKLPDEMVSRTRRLSLVSDSNGDTVAVYSTDPVSQSKGIVHVLERLGESWIATASIKVSEIVDDGDWPDDTEPMGQLQISRDGGRLLLEKTGTLILYTRSSTGWTAGNVFALPTDRQFLSAIADEILQFHYVLERDHVGFWLSNWVFTDDHWHQLSRHSLPFPLDGNDIALALNTTGNGFTVGSWDASSPPERTPTAWRFSLTSAGDIEIQDSVTGASAWSDSARLRMAVDKTANAIAIGWQDTTASDASLSSYRYETKTRSWYKAWHLPDIIPFLAKQAFVHSVRFSSNSRFLLLTNPHSDAANRQNFVGEILVIDQGIY